MKVALFACRLATAASLAVSGLFITAYTPDVRAADQVQATDPMLTGSILFSRSRYDSNASPYATALYRAAAGGGVATSLTPQTSGTLDLGAHWSPRGSAIVFERVNTAEWFKQSEIYRVDRDGKSLRPITVGQSRHQDPAWGRYNNWIAYLDGGVDQHQCVGLVRPNGNEQHALFCPSPSDGTLSAPQWTPDEKQLLVEIHYYDWNSSTLNPPAISDVYKVDAFTGKATRISHLIFAEAEDDLQFSPDGTRALYRWNETSGMEIVDFSTGKTVGSEANGPYGDSPRWSNDSRQIAFTQEIFLPGSTSEIFGAVFVMRADGTHVRQLTNKPVANDYYYAVGWSDNDSHILLDRTRQVIQGLHASQIYSVHVLDVGTQAITEVTDNGIASQGAWKQL